MSKWVYQLQQTLQKCWAKQACSNFSSSNFYYAESHTAGVALVHETLQSLYQSMLPTLIC